MPVRDFAISGTVLVCDFVPSRSVRKQLKLRQRRWWKYLNCMYYRVFAGDVPLYNSKILTNTRRLICIGSCVRKISFAYISPSPETNHLCPSVSLWERFFRTVLENRFALFFRTVFVWRNKLVPCYYKQLMVSDWCVRRTWNMIRDFNQVVYVIFSVLFSDVLVLNVFSPVIAETLFITISET